MDKFFENMDERFNSIENELNYNYNSDNWLFAEKMLDDVALDSSFINAAQVSASTAGINFESIDDAFLDDAFIEANTKSTTNYQSSYFNEYKNQEDNFVQNEAFVGAAAFSKSSYQSEYWKEADIALKNEGLHHEYKTEYWNEAKMLLAKDSRKGFFFTWGTIASILLLISFIGLQFNNFTSTDIIVSNTTKSQKINTPINTTLKTETNSAKSNTLSIESTPINSRQHKLNDTQSESFPTDKKDSKNSNLNNITKINHVLNTEILIQKENQSNKNNNSKRKVTKTTTLQNHETINVSLAINKVNNNFETKVNDNSKQINNTELSKINYRKLKVIETNFKDESIQKIEFIPNIINPTHEFGVKFEKGIGNVFTKNKTTFSARNAFYIDYRYKPTTKLRQFQFGIEGGLYHMNLDNLVYEQNYSVYQQHGGADHYWSKMTYKDLVFVSTSINIFYELSKKHKIKLAIGIDKLLTSKIDMQYKEISDLQTHSNNGEWGLNKGINTFDLTFGLGYEFKINQKFAFVVDSKFGTIDKTNNTYLRTDKMNRDLSVLLGLKYNLFTKH